MKNFLKGAAVTAIIIIVSMAVHIFCNIHNINLDPIITGPTSSVCAMIIYNGLTKNEKNNDDQDCKK